MTPSSCSIAARKLLGDRLQHGDGDRRGGGARGGGRARGGGGAVVEPAGRDRRRDHRRRAGSGCWRRPTTVESGAYRRALEAQGRGLDVIEVAAPRLAPFIQDGLALRRGDDEMARGYCAPLREADVDTLILGCTALPAGGADAAADPRPRRAAGERRPRGRGGDPAHPRAPGLGPRATTRAPTSFFCTGWSPRSAKSPPASSRCPSARSAKSSSPSRPAPAHKISIPRATRAHFLARRRSMPNRSANPRPTVRTWPRSRSTCPDRSASSD